MISTDASAVTAPIQFIETNLAKYAYRRFGGGTAPPLVCLQHFTGTLDNWDPAVTDLLASGRAEHLPNAMLLTYPDAGHGSLFQFPDCFVRHAQLFLDS